MEIKDLTTTVRRLSKISDNKFDTNYTPELVVIIKDIDEYNGFSIYTKFDNPEDKRSFAKDILRPIQDRYKVQFHQHEYKL